MYQRLTGHVTQADKAQSDYFYVPFDLPAPARRLHVRYRYSAAMSSNQVEGGNVIDLGLFDPRGNDFPGGAGFRGWSGSARSEFTITPEEATPGYLPGPLPAGEYQVILGLYRIWEQGADYEIEIEADPDEEPHSTGASSGYLPGTKTGPSNSSSARKGSWETFDAATVGTVSVSNSSSARGGGWEGVTVYPPPTLPGEATIWLRGDLQSHTYHSDAQGSLEQIIGKARALGLDFLAVTDHNTISHHSHLAALADESFLLLYGQEVTTYYGHMNVWNTGRWCDFRCRTTADLRAIIDLAHQHGGLCSINHPKTGGPAWEYGFELPFDTMEVWQGPWAYHNEESLALWERLLTAGQQIRAVGGSDYHCPAGEDTNLLRLGQPTTWVQVKERSHRGIFEAIHAGRVSLSARPAGPRIELTAVVGEAGEQVITMGEAVSVAPATEFTVTATVWDGGGFTCQFVVDGMPQGQQMVTAAQQSFTLTTTIAAYVRAELIGDLPADQVPPDAPVTLDCSGWRWALANPIFVNP